MNRRSFVQFLTIAGALHPMSASSRNVSWVELFSESPEINYARIFSVWAPKISLTFEVAPIGISAFGNVFFSKRDDSVHCLSPISGTLEKVASSMEQFRTRMNTETWQVEHLHSRLLAQVLSMGVPKKATQVYGLAPHPHFTGGVSLERSKPTALDPEIWHTISFQSFYRAI